jgi:hypothetical protein
VEARPLATLPISRREIFRARLGCRADGPPGRAEGSLRVGRRVHQRGPAHSGRTLRNTPAEYAVQVYMPGLSLEQLELIVQVAKERSTDSG